MHLFKSYYFLVILALGFSEVPPVTSVQPYKLEMETGNYEMLNEAMHLNVSENFIELQLPFEFEFFTSSSPSIAVSIFGTIDFPEGWLQGIEGNFDAGTTSNSGIFYSLEGEAPKRIAKIEWRNLVSRNQPGVLVNFQVWLREDASAIEIHYGDSRLPRQAFDDVFGPGATGPRVGLFQTNGSSCFVSGSAFNPQMHARGFHMLDEMPPAGLIYRFTKKSFHF